MAIDRGDVQNWPVDFDTPRKLNVPLRPPFRTELQSSLTRGGVLWALKNPPPPVRERSTRLKKVHLNVQEGPVCVINDATVEELNKFCYLIS